MPNSDQQAAVEKLKTGVHENRIEIVALRGLIRALLLQSTWTDDKLKEFVMNEAGNPVGTVDPEHAVSVANLLIQETAWQREKNRKKSQ